MANPPSPLLVNVVYGCPLYEVNLSTLFLYARFFEKMVPFEIFFDYYCISRLQERHMPKSLGTLVNTDKLPSSSSAGILCRYICVWVFYQFMLFQKGSSIFPLQQLSSKKPILLGTTSAIQQVLLLYLRGIL